MTPARSPFAWPYAEKPLDPRVATALLGTYLVRRVPCGCPECTAWRECLAAAQSQGGLFSHLAFRTTVRA